MKRASKMKKRARIRIEAYDPNVNNRAKTSHHKPGSNKKS